MEKNFIIERFEHTAVSIHDMLSLHGTVSASDIKMYNPLVLAYIGDAVYEMFVRTLLVANGSMQVAELHKRAIKYVKAKSQADILERLEQYLIEDELDIVKRGRNTKTSTVPKNAEIADYRYATGLEALIGYLFLTGNIERLIEIFEKIIDITK